MNATVNWLKRRVSLTTTTTTTTTTTQSPAQRDSQDTFVKTNEMPVGSRAMATSRPPTPSMMPHEMLDPASPLSLLVATSKLTTFPYGELQALNARMNVGPKKVNSPRKVNGIRMEMNPVQREGEEDDVVAAMSMSFRGIKVPTREQVNQITAGGQTMGNTLLPSAIPTAGQSENISPITFQTPLIPLRPTKQPNSAQEEQSIPKQQNATASVLPRTRSATNSSHKTSASLSSTQNTRSSKRLKTSHPAPLPQPTQLKPVRTAPVNAEQPPATPAPAPAKQKRVLPVRHGHVDILDGEISLLSTPQRSGSIPPFKPLLTIDRPTFETSHKVILVDNAIPSTPTTRYEPFLSTTIPDPNTSPTHTRQTVLPAPQITLRTLPRPRTTSDPLPDTLYAKPHRKHEFTEIRLRNREREKIDYESSLLERQLQILKSEDWRKIVAPAAAEREQLKEGEIWDWEGRRERRIELLEGVLRRVRTWREAEIKMRRGGIVKGFDDEEGRIEFKRRRVPTHDEDGEEQESKRKREESGHEEVQEGRRTRAEEGRMTRAEERRKGPLAFGQEIPKMALRNREFKIPKEWVEEKMS